VRHSDHSSHHMPFYLKALILVCVGIFLVIGLIGLILPIIPGILFLALAALLLAKISSRFAYYLNNNSSWQRMRRYWRSMSFLSVAQQVKLSFWFAARSLVSGIDSAVNLARKLVKKNRA
jgi:uncharacterized membrane protein YbaN (DUF454 family)